MNDKEKKPGNPWTKSLLIWVGVLFALVLFVQMIDGGSRAADRPGDPLFRIRPPGRRGQCPLGHHGDRHRPAIQAITGKLDSGEAFHTIAPADANVADRLIQKGVAVQVKAEEQSSIWLYMLYNSLPFLLILGISFFVMRQMQKNAGSGAMGFGKSRAPDADREAGPRDLRRRRRHRRGPRGASGDRRVSSRTRASSRGSAARSPRARCWSARPAPARPCSPAPSRVRRACPSSPSPARTSSRCSSASAPAASATCSTRPRRSAPCIVFIDEIDAVGRHRGAGLGNGNDEREQTLNQLLVEMDGFEANEGIIIIAATNRPDVLDPALLRPGRFDRQVVVPRPDIDGREQILAVHMKKVPLAPDVDPRVIARGTPGFSGADLANLVNEAALLAARSGKRLVAMKEFEEAKDKVHDGHRAQVDGHDRGREAHDRLSRGRPRHRRAPRAGVRPDPQGDDHPARPRAGHGHAPARARQLQLSPRQDVREPRGRDGRPRRRGSDLRLRQGHLRRLVRHPATRPASPATWSPAGACPTRSARCNMPRPTRKCSSAIRSTASRTCRTRPRRRSTRKSAGSSRRATSAPRSARPSIASELETLAKALLEYETLSGDEIKKVLAGEHDRPRRRQGPGDPGRRLLDPQGQAAQAPAIGGPAAAGA